MKSLGLKTTTVLAIALLAGCSTSPVQPSANQGTDKNTVTKPLKVYPEPTYLTQYPFTKEELWAKILKLTASHRTITRQQVERALDVILIPETPTQEYPTSATDEGFKMTAGKDWYFSLYFSNYLSSQFKNQRRSTFAFQWGEKWTVPAPIDMCLDVDQIKPSLLKQGWVDSKAGHPPGAPWTYEYYNEKGGHLRITIEPDRNCMMGINLFSPTLDENFKKYFDSIK